MVALYKERPSPSKWSKKIYLFGLFSLLLNAQHISNSAFYVMKRNTLEL